MRRLSQGGFKPNFVRSAILPDWWEDSYANDSKVLPDIEIRVARFLGRTIEDIRSSTAALVPPTYESIQLRRVRDLDRDRLGPAIHAALQIAGAVVRSSPKLIANASSAPGSALDWRNHIARDGPALTLQDLLTDLWGRGIPVVPLEALPTPSFQGLVCIVEDRPVIMLGHKHDEPGRAAFVVAHEVGHLAAGDCVTDQPVVDADDEVPDNSQMERNADLFATRVLVGRDEVPQIDGNDFRQLAQTAITLEQETGADASVIIAAWARRTDDYLTAMMAAKALYRAQGARALLRKYLSRHVDLEAASESDRDLLRCVIGETEQHGLVA